ncbi:hypothetical protein COEREDRAFT_5649 [Coemansia reversa NRRL 1564]|uniref:Uncharacterized protein n=1 Tax=Coemansia reversa (strain ATCC 12441 / NRRL 1564) TaxID=763665 RepID=A0A2G5BJC3_COERN|nr:hypothetical protein COEREDRAFT_5649 [Coemansia reversa NRRL 1564]|eukprot:PIA19118.1 hypothetical protein COEREDRAFT_5649 [Coemansia reversa NRRL 1564]
MVKLQLSSLDEFVASLSRLDYEAAKVASGKVMEDHIRMGALMFSLLTIEMMYTSMDYLTPGNFRRGNNYLLNMYTPLPRQLNKLLRKLVAEYEEEYQRLVSLRIQTSNVSSAMDSRYAKNTYGSAFEFAPQHSVYNREDGSKTPAYASQTLYSDNAKIHRNSSESSLGSATHNTSSRAPQQTAEQNNPTFIGHDHRSFDTSGIKPAAGFHASNSQSGADPAEPFDPSQYLANTEEAEGVLAELETVRQFIEFITKFVEVRKTMVVLYRFIAVTGPVLHKRKLRIMLRKCETILQAIEPNPLFESLLEHVRKEIWLVCILVDWDSHILAYDFLQSVTQMKKAKVLLKAWLDSLPAFALSDTMASRASTGGHSIYGSISEALSWRRGKDSGDDSRNVGRGLLYSALAKSSRMVQNFLWHSSGSSGSDENQDQDSGGLCGIVIWISSWMEHLSFKTTAYFQQIIAPYRTLHRVDMNMSTRQSAVMSDMWSRSTTVNKNLYEAITTFMQANDGCFVALLFESSKHHPFSADGFAVSGTKLQVSDYRVQACAVLFCFANQKLLLSRGISLKDSLVHDVHSVRRDTETSATTELPQQSDVEWFRQNCLPDILYILDSNHKTLDLELLGSNPLLSQLGPDADELLVELCESVHDTVEEAAAELAISKEAMGARVAAEKRNTSAAAMDMHPGSAKSWFSQAPSAFRLSAVKSGLTAVQKQRREQHHYEDADVNIGRQSLAAHQMTNDNYAVSLDAQKRVSVAADIHHSAMPMPVHEAATGDDFNITPVAAGVASCESAACNDVGDDDDISLNLYTTYLQKSHLRNNLQHTRNFRGPNGGRRLTSRHTGQRIYLDAQPHGDRLEYSGKASDVFDQRRSSERIRYLDDCNGFGEVGELPPEAEPMPQSDHVDHSDSHNHVTQVVDSATSIPTKESGATNYIAGKDRITTGDAGRLENNKSPPAESVQASRHLRTLATQESGNFSQRNGRATTSASGSAYTRPRRVSLSIRSFFRPSPRPNTNVRGSSAAIQSLPETEVDRRVRCGERLNELFGAWDAEGALVTEDDLVSHGGTINRPGSIHSLSFSTPTRASIGRRSSAVMADAAAVDSGQNMLPSSHDTETASDRFVLRLPQSSIHVKPPSLRPQGSRPPATRRASEFGFATAVERLQYYNPQLLQRPQPQSPPPAAQQQPHISRGSYSKSQHHPQHRLPSHTGPRPVTPTAAPIGSEGYTYLYSRVALPNIVLVAMFLDTDKGIERRREAEHAWDKVVDAVRGMPLFERLMSLPS